MTIRQLDNGKWQHSKSKIEWSDRVACATDYRFCCEWEGASKPELMRELKATRAERRRAQEACEQIARRLV